MDTEQGPETGSARSRLVKVFRVLATFCKLFIFWISAAVCGALLAVIFIHWRYNDVREGLASAAGGGKVLVESSDPHDPYVWRVIQTIHKKKIKSREEIRRLLIGTDGPYTKEELDESGNQLSIDIYFVHRLLDGTYYEFIYDRDNKLVRVYHVDY